MRFTCERSRANARGRSASRGARQAVKRDGFLETRARQVLTPVLPRPSRPRRRSAPPTEINPAIAAVLLSSELRLSTRGGAIATVLPLDSPEARPSWRAERSRHDGQESFLPFRKAARAKRAELTAARRQNAHVQLQAALLKARDSTPLVLHFKEANSDEYLEHRA